MVFRTTVRDGLIVINTHGEVPDGTPVKVELAPKPAKRAGKKRTARRPAKAPDLGFGMWKHRSDITDAAAYARELRVRSGRRQPRA